MRVNKKYGWWAFLIAFFGAIVLGLLDGFGVMSFGVFWTVLLVLAGLVVGFMNIKNNEAVPLMVALLFLGVGAGVFSIIPTISGWIDSVLSALSLAFIPAGLVVAVKTIYMKGKK